jgi:hypothetical protein
MEFTLKILDSFYFTLMLALPFFVPFNSHPEVISCFRIVKEFTYKTDTAIVRF